jgi:hypothetical protein
VNKARIIGSLRIAVAVSLGALALGQTASATRSSVAKAVIWPNLTITVSPKSVEHGTVVFKVRNRDKLSHNFAVNGVVSKPIKPNHVVILAVHFKKPGLYFLTLADPDPWTQVGTKQVGGTVRVA